MAKQVDDTGVYMRGEEYVVCVEFDDGEEQTRVVTEFKTLPEAQSYIEGVNVSLSFTPDVSYKLVDPDELPEEFDDESE